MNEPLTNKSPNKTSSGPENGNHLTWPVLFLCVAFLCVGILFALCHRQFNTEAAWVILIIPFCFSMVGALVLFYFLSSSAQIEDESYKLGGAAAGFLVLFTLFYNITKGPFLEESSWHQIGGQSLSGRLLPLAKSYKAITGLKNQTIKTIADTTLSDTQKTFSQLSEGTYTIQADELPVYLLPMIKNAKKTYYATQFVFPETFWSQYWSEEYFEDNIQAVKARNVKLTRIFILEGTEAKAQKEILNTLIKKHVDNGLNIRIIDADKYRKNINPEDLRDILIVDDEVTAMLLLDKGGQFSRVEFSVDPQVILKRKTIYQKLLSNSMTYEQWKTNYYERWQE